MNDSGSSVCHTFSTRQVELILHTKMATASLAFLACLASLLPLCVLLCCVRVWKTFVHRLKLYLNILALVLAVMYVLQVLPVTTRETESSYNNTTTTQTSTLPKSHNWEIACKAIAFVLQYVQWVMLLVICWMIVFLLWLTQRLLQAQDQTVRVAAFPFKTPRLEFAGAILTLLFPLLFLWTPFTTNNYGLGGEWCGIVITHTTSGCSNSTPQLFPGLGYQIGLWYGPAILVTLFCTVGVVVVTRSLWIYYKTFGRTEQMTSSLVKGIPPAMYLVIYNVINAVNITSLVFHAAQDRGNRDISTDYRLWLVHAVTGPCRALAVPFAFVLGHFLIYCCFRQRSDSYTRIK